MSASFVDFQPSTLSAFTFQPTMAGNQYTVVVTWNLFGERFYINLYDLSGNLILCRGIAETGPSLQASFTWLLGTATATTAIPHNVPLGSVASAYVSQTGTGFDGVQTVLSTGANTLTYALLASPGEAAAVAGVVNFPLNLVAGYGIGYLLFHDDTNRFEYG